MGSTERLGLGHAVAPRADDLEPLSVRHQGQGGGDVTEQACSFAGRVSGDVVAVSPVGDGCGEILGGAAQVRARVPIGGRAGEDRAPRGAADVVGQLHCAGEDRAEQVEDVGAGRVRVLVGCPAGSLGALHAAQALTNEVGRRYAAIIPGRALSWQRYGLNSPFARPPHDAVAGAAALDIARTILQSRPAEYRDHLRRLIDRHQTISRATAKAIDDGAELPSMRR